MSFMAVTPYRWAHVGDPASWAQMRPPALSQRTIRPSRARGAARRCEAWHGWGKVVVHDDDTAAAIPPAHAQPQIQSLPLPIRLLLHRDERGRRLVLLLLQGLVDDGCRGEGAGGRWGR